MIQHQDKQRPVMQQFMWGFVVAGSVILSGSWLFSKIAGFELDVSGGLIALSSMAIILIGLNRAAKQRNKVTPDLTE